MTLTGLSENRKKFILWGVLVCFLGVTCGTVPNARGLTLSEERTLGRKLLDKIREHFPLIEDGEILDYVQSVGNRVVRQMGPVTYEYRFFLIDEATPNAFAIPGGYVFLYRGLVEMMDTEGEMASIISHELAHIQSHHIKKSLEKGKILSIASVVGMLAGAFLGLKPTATQALATGVMAGARSMQLQYSREHEEEADRLGFQYLTAAGYDPQDMVSMMRKIGRGGWRGNSRIPSYLSTHPGVSERVSYLETMMKRYRETVSESKQKSPPQGDFYLMQAALISEYAEPAVAMDRFKSWEKEEDRSAAVTYGLGRLHLRQRQIPQAISALQEAARKEPNSGMVLGSLGSAYFQQGRLPEAQKTLQAALLLNPDASMVHFNLALVLQQMGHKDEALQHFRQSEQLAPLFPEIDYHLGVLLGQMDQLGSAHFHLGRYYQQKQDWDLASFHYKKAKPLLENSPEKQETIDRELKEIKEKKKERPLR